jgi:hypothetical protein
MRKIILMIVVLLVGCATDDMRKRPSSLELTSSHSAYIVATCIVGRWADAKAHVTEWGSPADYPINMRKIAGGYSVSATANNLFKTSKGALADIQDTPHGSTTRYFKSGLGTEDPFENAVKECQ